MATTKIGNELWDFVDAQGREMHLGPQDAPTGDFTNSWLFLPERDEIHPPSQNWSQTMAIMVDRCLAEETIECEYQISNSTADVGIIFGAQDSDHYYWARVPERGTSDRARGFWAAISKADGSGYFRNLAIQLMPNCPFYYDYWMPLRVERRNNRIQMWVNGVAGPSVIDDTYGAGRVGIAGFSRYSIRKLKIDGRTVDGPPWPGGDQRREPWFHVGEELGVTLHGSVRLCKISEDEILMVSLEGNPDKDNFIYVSRDRGRTWSKRGPVSERFASFGIGDGLQRRVHLDDQAREMFYADSADGGLTWSDPQECKLLGNYWQDEVFKPGTRSHVNSITELRDGTLLAMIYHNHEGLTDRIPNPSPMLLTWGLPSKGIGLGIGLATRSEDRGRTWSEPVFTDHATRNPDERPGPYPCTDFSENPSAQLPSGRIVTLARPNFAPFMWQSHSDDGGRSWSPACYAPFSGHGYPNLVATRSGYLAVIKRGQGTSINVSYDGGVNWDAGTTIDLFNWYNGDAIEVEPDVLLVAYHGLPTKPPIPTRPSRFRLHLIRLSPDGPIPLRP